MIIHSSAIDFFALIIYSRAGFCFELLKFKNGCKPYPLAHSAYMRLVEGISCCKRKSEGCKGFCCGRQFSLAQSNYTSMALTFPNQVEEWRYTTNYVISAVLSTFDPILLLPAESSSSAAPNCIIFSYRKPPSHEYFHCGRFSELSVSRLRHFLPR